MRRLARRATYEISRRLESGEPLSWAAVIGAVWSRAGKELGWLALVSLFTLILWLDFAVFLFLMFYGLNIPSLPQLFANIFTTAYGMTFLLVGNGLGAIIALFVFSITAISPPLLVDREVDFVTAMTTSVRAVLANPARHAGLGGCDRRRPCNFVRDSFRRAPGDLPDPRPRDVASLPPRNRLVL